MTRHQGVSLLAYPSTIDLSTSALRFLATRLRVHRRAIGSRWRRLSPARQALLVLAHLRCGDIYTRLASGFHIGVATVYWYVREALNVLGALARSLPQVMDTCAAKAFVILDGTLLPIDRIAADRPFYSGCEDLSAPPRAGSDPYSGWPSVPCA